MVEEIPTPQLIKHITANIYSVGVTALDAPLRCKENEDGNTLLHFAVMFGLYSDVEQILNLGASSSRKNKYGLTPKDIAVDQGDQIMIQMLGRRDKYRKQKFERMDSKTSDNDNNYCDDEGNTAHMSTKVSEQSELTCNIKCCFDTRAISTSSYGSEPFIFADTDHKVLEWRYNVEDVYEDYLDWTDSTRSKRLQNTLEKLRSEESSLQTDIKEYDRNKKIAQCKLSELFDNLREIEHGYCLQIWNVIEEERKSRDKLQKDTIEVASYKQTLHMLKEKILWTGKMLVRHVNSILYSGSWSAVNVNVGCEFLTFYSEDNTTVVARVPPKCIKSLMVHEKEVILYVEKCLDHPYNIPNGLRATSSYSNVSGASNPPSVSMLISFNECQRNNHIIASEVPDCVKFLNSIYCLRSDISIMLVSANGDMTSYRPSTADDSLMTSLESLTLSSRGTLKDENEEAYTLSSVEEGNKKDRLSQKSDEETTTSISSNSGRGLNICNTSSDNDGKWTGQNNYDATLTDKSGIICEEKSFVNQMNKHRMIHSKTRHRTPSEGDLSCLMVADGQNNREISYNKEKAHLVSSSVNIPKLSEHRRKVDERSCSLSYAVVNSNGCDGTKTGRGDRRTFSVLESRPKKRYVSNVLLGVSGIYPISANMWGHPSEEAIVGSHDEGLLSAIESCTLKIDRLRTDRAVVESRLVKAIAERERLLGILHYLQFLKSLVSNPPKVPSRLMGTVSLPSIDKAMAAYSECSERVYKAIDENCAVDIDESQLFIASMLDQTSNVSKRNDSTEGGTGENHGDSIYDIPIAANNRLTSCGKKRRSRILGPPPNDIQGEFEQVIAVLEELWNTDIGTFETVDKLSQILLLRERTWKSLSALQPDSNNLSQSFDNSDLFDVVI